MPPPEAGSATTVPPWLAVTSRTTARPRPELADGLVIDPDIRPPGGESVRDLYLRVATFCDQLAASVANAGPAGHGDVLVIAHGGTVRVPDAYIHGVPVDQMTWRPVGNATVVRIPEFATQLRGGNR